MLSKRPQQMIMWKFKTMMFNVEIGNVFNSSWGNVMILKVIIEVIKERVVRLENVNAEERMSQRVPLFSIVVWLGKKATWMRCIGMQMVGKRGNNTMLLSTCKIQHSGVGD